MELIEHANLLRERKTRLRKKEGWKVDTSCKKLNNFPGAFQIRGLF